MGRARIWTALLLTATLALVSCGTTNVSTDYRPGASGEKGTVVFSLTRTRIGSFLTPYTSGVTLYYADYDANRCGSFSMGDSTLLGPFIKGNFDGGAGRLFVVELPAGTYSFDSWSLKEGTQIRVSSGDPFAIPFTVEPGTVKYLGEINLELLHRQGFLGGMAPPASANIKLKDSHERDLGMLAKEYPRIPLAEVKLERLRFGTVPDSAKRRFDNTCGAHERLIRGR